jgi:hypothetical protein
MQQPQTKPKMDETKKIKLVYSGELLLISLVFLTLGILMLTGVYQTSETRRTIFVWITLFGGSYTLFDFFWTLFSAKHRKKSSLLDKIAIVPVGITFISYDLYVLLSKTSDANLHHLVIGIAFLYIGALYIFESIFHYYHPIPGLLEDDKKEDKKEAAPVTDAPNDATNTDKKD